MTRPRARALRRAQALAWAHVLRRAAAARALGSHAAPPRPGPDRWVDVDDGARLAVWVAEPQAPVPPEGPDDGPPTVVLVHGWTLAAAAWDRTVRLLGEQRPDVRVVRYDQRGHGLSLRAGAPPGGRGAASVRRLGDDLEQVVGAVAPRGALVLAGHSMGGMAVLSAVGGHPAVVAQRPVGVLLCSTSAGGLAAAGRPVAPVMAALAALPAGVLVPRAPRRLTQRTSYGPDVDPAVVLETLRAMGPVSGRATGEWFAALMAHDETAALPALAGAGIPVQVVVGAADRLTPPRHAAELAAALPGATLTVAPRAGHMLPVERPDVVVTALGALLAALGASR